MMKEKHGDVGIMLKSLEIEQSRKRYCSCNNFKTEGIPLNELPQSPNTNLLKTKKGKRSNSNRFSSLFMSAREASPMNWNTSLEIRVEIFFASGNEKPNQEIQLAALNYFRHTKFHQLLLYFRSGWTQFPLSLNRNYMCQSAHAFHQNQEMFYSRKVSVIVIVFVLLPS